MSSKRPPNSDDPSNLLSDSPSTRTSDSEAQQSNKSQEKASESQTHQSRYPRVSGNAPTAEEHDIFMQYFSHQSNTIYSKVRDNFNQLMLLHTKFGSAFESCMEELTNVEIADATLVDDLRKLKDLSSRKLMEEQELNVDYNISPNLSYSKATTSRLTKSDTSSDKKSVQAPKQTEVIPSSTSTPQKTRFAITGKDDECSKSNSQTKAPDVSKTTPTSSTTTADDGWTKYLGKKKIRQYEVVVSQEQPTSRPPTPMQNTLETKSCSTTPLPSTTKPVTESTSQKPLPKKKTPKKAVKTPVKANEEMLDDEFWAAQAPMDLENLDYSQETKCVQDYKKVVTESRARLIRFNITTIDHIDTSDLQSKLIEFRLKQSPGSADSAGAERRRKVASEFLATGKKEFSTTMQSNQEDLLKKFLALEKNLNDEVAIDILYFKQSFRNALEEFTNTYLPMIFTKETVEVGLDLNRLPTDPVNTNALMILDEPRFSDDNLQKYLRGYVAARRAARQATTFVPDKNVSALTNWFDEKVVNLPKHMEKLRKPENQEELIEEHNFYWALQTLSTITNEKQTKGTILRSKFIELLMDCREEEIMFDSHAMTSFEADMKEMAGSMEDLLKVYTEEVFLRRIGDGWGRWGRNQ